MTEAERGVAKYREELLRRHGNASADSIDGSIPARRRDRARARADVLREALALLDAHVPPRSGS